MNLYFMKPELYSQRYNCSQLTDEEWQKVGKKQVFFGLMTILTGIIFQLVYTPFIVAMLQPKFYLISCYKLMLFLGIMDLCSILIGCIISGYFLLVGAVFCTHPAMIYFSGIVGLCSWCGSCIACILLTINRCIDIYLPDLSKILFNDKRTWFWLLIPLAVFIRVIIYEPVLCFNSNYMAWFYDPFYGMDFLTYKNTSAEDYYNITNFASNIATILSLSLGNSLLCYYVFKKTRKDTGSVKLKRQFVIQVCAICSFVIITAIIYTYMQYFYTPAWLIVIASMCYTSSNGAQALSYLLLNPTLRKATFEIFHVNKIQYQVSPEKNKTSTHFYPNKSKLGTVGINDINKF